MFGALSQLGMLRGPHLLTQVFTVLVHAAQIF